MADKELLIAPDSLKVITAEVTKATRPLQVSGIEGVAASAMIVEGQGKVMMSIWPKGATDSSCIMLDHDELVALIAHLNDLHELICTGADRSIN